MRVYLPYTFRYEPTWDALAGYDPVPIEMDGERAYLDFFIERWQQGEGFVVVEHDVVPHRGAVESLWDCERPWCAFGYTATQFPYFGCVKFSAQLIAALPEVWNLLDDALAPRLVGEVPMLVGGVPMVPGLHLSPYTPPWRYLDSWFVAHVTRHNLIEPDRQVLPHRHYPDVVNARPLGVPA